jgi:hypothetical protein
MEKAFPCQEKVRFLVEKRERILKNPLGITIFSMDLNGDSKTDRIFHFEPCSANESVLGADEGMKQVARFHHFLVAVVVSFGDIEPGPDIRKVWGKDNDFQPSFLCRLFHPSADPFARAGDYGGVGGKRHDQIKDGFPILILHRSDNSDFHFGPPEIESARDLKDHERSELIASLTTGGLLRVVEWCLV